MILIIIILSLLFLVLYISRKRTLGTKILVNKMIYVYDKMEIALIEHKIDLNKDIIEFLKSHKNLIVNHELADIRIILALKRKHEEMEKKKVKMPERNIFNEDRIPKELLELADEFKIHVFELIRLSFLKWGFIRFFSFSIFILSISYMLNAINKLVKSSRNFLGNTVKPAKIMVSIMKGENQDDITRDLFPI